MNILFICGSLEPGQDGVGDYTRRLACELKRQGNNTSIISLFDHKVQKTADEIQLSDGIEISVLRIPTSSSTDIRRCEAKKWIEHFNPCFTSLQFVIFSFHKKGLPSGLGSFLKSIGSGLRWHLMLHELWVGMPMDASKSHVLWGWLQRKIIFKLIRKLSPEIIHTQSKLYTAQLEMHGFKPSYLPLFSNIPYGGNPSLKLVQKGTDHISLIIFGTIHPNAQVEQLIEEVQLYSKNEGKPISMTLIGRCGQEEDSWLNKWQSNNLTIHRLGDQSAQTVSDSLRKASIGICTAALAMVDKSGTVAAMRDHGLPIICISKPWNARGIPFITLPKGIFEFRPGCIKHCLTFAPDSIRSYSVSDVAHKFLNSLLKIKNE
jgi:hypothetical protein